MYDRKYSGALIQAKRLEAGLTQEALAEKLECSSRHIINVERGAVGLSVETMLKVCEIFHVTPTTLLIRADDEADPDIDWVTTSLRSLKPEKRKLAISIIRPYIDAALQDRD